MQRRPGFRAGVFVAWRFRCLLRLLREDGSIIFRQSAATQCVTATLLHSIPPEPMTRSGFALAIISPFRLCYSVD